MHMGGYLDLLALGIAANRPSHRPSHKDMKLRKGIFASVKERQQCICGSKACMGSFPAAAGVVVHVRRGEAGS